MRFWRRYEFCQQGVLLAMRDLIRPGDSCIDGGVFHGWYSVVMSRLVGLQGSVYGIEANPEVVPIALENLRVIIFDRSKSPLHRNRPRPRMRRGQGAVRGEVKAYRQSGPRTEAQA